MNPWRFSFDPLTGDMYIGDVGEWIFEEVDFMPAGVSDYNFGWRCWEGTFDQTTPGTGHPIYADRCEPASAYDFPIFEYSSDIGDCAVTGGYVYRGSQYDSLYGFYLFGDFCTGNLWVTKQDENGNFTTLSMNNAGFMVSTFGVDVNGELYAGSFGGKADTIYRVTVP